MKAPFSANRSSRRLDLTVPGTMGELLDAARVAQSLGQLTGLFGRMIARDGFFAHCCVAVDGHDPASILFGDAQRLAEVGAKENRLVIPVEDWQRDGVELHLFGAARSLDSAGRARLHGLAAVYVTYAAALFEREQDVATSVGLGLAQRQCLALLLVGRRTPGIADALDLSPLAVDGHIRDAMHRIGARTQAEAVSIAARRGWLAGLELPVRGTHVAI